MNTFGSKLNEYLDILGITQVKAAQVAGCSRAMIYSVLNDERNLSEDKFQTMLAEIPFSETQADVLRKLYYADKYPKGVIEKILCIKKNLSDPKTDPAGRQTPAAIPLPTEQTAVNGEHDLCALAAAMLTDDACKKAITNFSYRAENFDHAVYSALCKRKTPIDFQHVICFENSNRTTVNIQNIFGSVRYIRLRHSPLYYYVEDMPRRFRSLYPQFLITDRAVLLFHEKINIGIYLTGRAVIEDTTAAVEQFLTNCKPLAQISQDILALKDMLLKNSDNHILDCVANFACDLQNADYAFFDALTRPDLPNREILIQIAEKHYAQYGQSYEDFFLPLRAIEKFAREGLTPNFPQNWTVPLPYEYRIEVLKRFRERVSQKSNRLILVKDSLLQVPDELWGIDIGENYMGFFGSISEDGSQYAGEYGITTQNRNIIADFRFYLDYIIRNKLFYSSEYAEAFIDSQILECERLKNQEE